MVILRSQWPRLPKSNCTLVCLHQRNWRNFILFSFFISRIISLVKVILSKHWVRLHTHVNSSPCCVLPRVEPIPPHEVCTQWQSDLQAGAVLVSGQLQPRWAEGRRSRLARVCPGAALPLGEQLPYMWVSTTKPREATLQFFLNIVDFQLSRMHTRTCIVRLTDVPPDAQTGWWSSWPSLLSPASEAPGSPSPASQPCVTASEPSLFLVSTYLLLVGAKTISSLHEVTTSLNTLCARLICSPPNSDRALLLAKQSISTVRISLLRGDTDLPIYCIF